MQDRDQGIVHVIGPELGAHQARQTIVCGDSHTSTHGAFGALAFGIGTSEVEHVLATQTLPQSKPPRPSASPSTATCPRRHRQGHRPRHHRPHRHRRRHRLRHRVRRLRHPRALHGRPHDRLQHEHRSRRPRRHDRPRRDHLRLPQGPPLLARRATRSGTRPSPTGAPCPPIPAPLRPRTPLRRRHPRALRHLGHLARHVHHHRRRRPHARRRQGRADRKSFDRASSTWASNPARPSRDIKIDTVFVGSCTNGRIEDLRAAAAIVKGHHVATKIRAMVVPGSQAVKRQAEAEGLDPIFTTPASTGASPAAPCASP